MTTHEERIVLTNLADLLASDLTAADDETLIAGVRDAERTADDAIRWSGALLGELKRRHSWSEMVQLTGMKQTTLHTRVHGRSGQRQASDDRP